MFQQSVEMDIADDHYSSELPQYCRDIFNEIANDNNNQHLTIKMNNLYNEYENNNSFEFWMNNENSGNSNLNILNEEVQLKKLLYIVDLFNILYEHNEYEFSQNYINNFKEDINEIFRLTQYYVYLSKAENALRCLDDIEENIQQE